MLQQHKKSIGWKLSNLPGVNPSICMHKILMEEEAYSIRKQQRRLNPTILDVVKKEVTKLLAAGIIYPISNRIVLGHLVSNRGIEVDKAKIDIITSLPKPASVRDVHSFLRHVGFYRRFIKIFSKITLPLLKLLQKYVDFVFDKACVQAFEELKARLTSTPILQAPNWEPPFELMSDASNLALGAVLGQ
ncbi:Retrovirus-related Pol polyprotein, partial [Mucuna pruriens]